MRSAESDQKPAEVCRGANRRRGYVEAEQFTFPAYQDEFPFFTDLCTICGSDLNAWRIWLWMLALLAWEPKPIEFSHAVASLGAVRKGVRA